MADFMEIKNNNPRLKQSEIARELSKSTSTLQRYKKGIKMHSPYKILKSSNTNTRKQNTVKHTKHHLKLTSNDFKMNLIDFREISKKSVETNRKNR